MTNLFDRLRRTVYPRAAWARGGGKPPRLSSIILGMMLVMFAIVLLARAITFLFTAT